MIEELKNRILNVKDWIETKSFFYNNEYYIDIYIIFNNKPITKEQIRLKDKILYVCREFLEENDFTDKLYKNINDSKNLLEDSITDGFIIDICENDGGGVFDYKSIQSLLKESKIDFESLNININEFSGGASGQWQEIVCFVASSVASGITWDYIKALIDNELPMLKDCIKVQYIEKKGFKKVRKRVAEMTRIKEKEIYIVKFDKNKSDIQMNFMTLDKKIYVRCDNNYHIINLEVKEK
ncbi:hypothetical protein [Clostridium butyricum]|nr:hypothetical protein [Clostridium butyricum]KHD16001.1 hypothetical protein OA81_06935 [Clostridium butyricum]